MSPAARLRSIGWAVLLTICAALFVALTFRVNAVKSEVRLAERRIMALEAEKAMLETEFQTRASQQQLANWNEVEFGYRAPDAKQFLEGERQLAHFGTPRAPGAPSPIRVASAPRDEESPASAAAGTLVAMVSPMTGRALAAEMSADEPRPLTEVRDLSSRLSLGAKRIVLHSAQEGVE